MTPQALVQTARKLSPNGWKGQQTVIRRLSRTNRLPAKTMHDALRDAAKRYKDESPRYRTVRFCPNLDTPADVRAEYLRDPDTFGIACKDDLLGWTRHASNATVLKMTRNAGVQALILFERERPEAYPRMNVLADNRTRGFSWFQDKVGAMQWSEKQLDVMVAFTQAQSSNIWAGKPALLGTLLGQLEKHGRPPVEPLWFNERLENYSLLELIQPFDNATLHKAALAQCCARLMRPNSDSQVSQLESAAGAAHAWHARKPTHQDCLDLANRLDLALAGLRKEGSTGPDIKWRERSPMVLPWISMLGATPEDGQQAINLYQQLDPELLTFTTLAFALSGPKLDTIDNASELLCP